MNKAVEFQKIVPILKDAFKKNELVKLKISGASMRPLVYSGRDYVYLQRITGVTKKRDVILYARQNGEYVMHRIVKIKYGELFLAGDNQDVIERGIFRENVFAKAIAFERNGKYISCTSLKYKIYSFLWVLFLKQRTNLKKLNRKIRGK